MISAVGCCRAAAGSGERTDAGHRGNKDAQAARATDLLTQTARTHAEQPLSEYGVPSAGTTMRLLAQSPDSESTA